MANATKHRKRAHRSEKRHFSCLHSMKQFAPAGGFGLMPDLSAPGERPEKTLGPRRLMGGNLISKHVGGWLKSSRRRNRKRAGTVEAPV